MQESTKGTKDGEEDEVTLAADLPTQQITWSVKHKGTITRKYKQLNDPRIHWVPFISVCCPEDWVHLSW